MEISFNRVFMAQMCIGILCLLSSCSEHVESKKNQEQMDVASLTQEQLEVEYLDIASIEGTRVSVISQAGIEIELEPSQFQKHWSQYTSELEKIDQATFDVLFTIVLWDKNNHPYVIQLSNQGMKLGKQIYSQKTTAQFIAWIKQHMGERYPSSLQMDRMTLEALDMGMKRQIPEKMGKSIFTMIQAASLVTSEARIDAPLFPHYKINIEDGGKEYVQLNILSPTLLFIQDGRDYWYYQLDDSIFSYLKKVIPITIYPESNIRYLYRAENLFINHDKNLMKHANHDEDPLRLEVAVHQVSRILSEGTPIEDELAKGTSNLLLEFIFTDESNKEIYVFDDYFVFNETKYQLESVKERIWGELLEKTNSK